MLCLVFAKSLLFRLKGELIKRTNVSPRDALHLASAEVGNCKYLVTCDDRLIKKVKTGKPGLKIKPINPIDLVRMEVIKNAEN